MRSLVLLLLAGACADPPPNAPPPPPPAVPVAPTAPVPEPPAPATAFTCCADPKARAVVDAYLAIQRALVRSDAAAAAAAAPPFVAAANAAGAAELAPLGEALTGADLEAIRKAFGALSPKVVAYARSAGAGDLEVVEAFCPMVNFGWLQTEHTIRNPYYGDKMLTCGSFR